MHRIMSPDTDSLELCESLQVSDQIDRFWRGSDWDELETDLLEAAMDIELEEDSTASLDTLEGYD